jgi:hypothetical protein
MNNLTLVKKKREEKANKKKERTNSAISEEDIIQTEAPVSRNPYDMLERAKSNSIVAEGNYQTALDKFNTSVDQFDELFIPIMTNI